jgi:hypothetical protein
VKRIIILAVVSLLLAAASAQAAPQAQITGPNPGDCVGSATQPVTGTAAGQFDLNWTFTLSRDDTGALLQTRQGNGPSPPPGSNTLTTIDTTTLPVGVALRAFLRVNDSTGEATATHVFTPVYDRTPPAAPNITAVYAKSYRQLWIGVADVRDAGCSGGVGSYTVFTPNTGLGGTPNIDNHGVVNGRDHEVLTQPVLNGGTVLVQAFATDRVGVEGNPGIAQSVTLPSTLDTVLAGQVKHTGAPVVSGLRVGTGSNKTITDANGWYRLGLNSSSTYPVTYGWSASDPCTLPAFWCSNLGPVTDTLTTPIEVGIIVPRHRVMP